MWAYTSGTEGREDTSLDQGSDENSSRRRCDCTVGMIGDLRRAEAESIWSYEQFGFAFIYPNIGSEHHRNLDQRLIRPR